MHDIDLHLERYKIVGPYIIPGQTSTVAPEIYVLEGKTYGALVLGEHGKTTLWKRVGIMQNVGKQEIMPSVSQLPISNGYHNGEGLVFGDANLTSSNIKYGSQIYDTHGSFTSELPSIAIINEEVRKGKIGYQNSTKVIGSLEDIEGPITPSYEDIELGVGIYHNNEVTTGQLEPFAIRNGVKLYHTIGKVKRQRDEHYEPFLGSYIVEDEETILAGQIVSFDGKRARRYIDPNLPNLGSIQIGEYIQMGEYYDEPILWRCVDIDENGPLMLSDRILSIKPYDAAGRQHLNDYDNRRLNYGSNLWETSNMRSWLNSTASAGLEFVTDEGLWIPSGEMPPNTNGYSYWTRGLFNFNTVWYEIVNYFSEVAGAIGEIFNPVNGQPYNHLILYMAVEFRFQTYGRSSSDGEWVLWEDNYEGSGRPPYPGGFIVSIVAGLNHSTNFNVYDSEGNLIPTIRGEGAFTDGENLVTKAPLYNNGNDDYNAINNICQLGSDLYAIGYPSGLIKWTGSAWTQVATPFAGVTHLYGLVELGGKLYAGTDTVGKLLQWTPGDSTWTDVTTTHNDQVHILCLCVFNSEIYGGTAAGGRLFKWNGSDAWIEVADQYDSEQYIVSLCDFDGSLYGGTGTGKLLKWNGADAWEKIADGATGHDHVKRMVVCDSVLYGLHAITGSQSGYVVFKFNGVDEWTNLNQTCTSIGVFRNQLYVTSQSNNFKLELYRYNGATFDYLAVSDNTTSSSNDYALGSNLLEFNNKLYVGVSYNGLLLEWDSTYIPSTYYYYAGEKGFMAEGNFSANERSVIKQVTQKSLLNDNDKAMKVGGTAPHAYTQPISDVVENFETAYYHNVTDKMFLLDVKQVNKVWQNRTTLGDTYYIGKPTQKAVDNSEYKSDNLQTSFYWRYWLRSPQCSYSDSPHGVRYVHSDGDVYFYVANSIYLGVRPAFYLNLQSAVFRSGTGAASSPYIISKEDIASLDTKDGIAAGNGIGGEAIPVYVF
jgi:hypothetical protein